MNDVIKCIEDVGEPSSEAHLAAEYVNPQTYHDANGESLTRFSQLSELDLPVTTVLFLMSGLSRLEYDVPPEQLDLLHPAIAKLVVWDWVKHGVPLGYEQCVYHWTPENQQTASLHFWIQFALDLRINKNQADCEKLQTLSQTDAQRTLTEYFSVSY